MAVERHPVEFEDMPAFPAAEKRLVSRDAQIANLVQFIGKSYKESGGVIGWLDIAQQAPLNHIQRYYLCVLAGLFPSPQLEWTNMDGSQVRCSDQALFEAREDGESTSLITPAAEARRAQLETFTSKYRETLVDAARRHYLEWQATQAGQPSTKRRPSTR